jgi:hypothetical protein
VVRDDWLVERGLDAGLVVFVGGRQVKRVRVGDARYESPPCVPCSRVAPLQLISVQNEPDRPLITEWRCPQCGRTQRKAHMGEMKPYVEFRRNTTKSSDLRRFPV